MKNALNRTCGRRGAILSMELVLILPIFLLLIFSIVEFSMLMAAHSRVASAATSGARLMSIGGAGSEEVHDKVLEYLAAGTPTVWVIYPRSQEVVIHTPDRLARTDHLAGGEISAVARPADAVASLTGER